LALYKVVLLSEAKKTYKKIFISNRSIFRRIDNALEALRSDPFMGKSLKDKLKGKYSLRVGVYRIIYSLEKNMLIVYVLDIGHRRDIYR
jgi:mRNA interferase RelE/StbE